MEAVPQTLVQGINPWMTAGWFIAEIAVFFGIAYIIERWPGPFRKEEKWAAFKIAPQIFTLILVFKGIRMYNIKELFQGTRKDRLHVGREGVPEIMMIEMAHCLAEAVLNIIVEPPHDDAGMLVHHIFAAVMLFFCFAPYGHAYMPYACGMVHISDLLYCCADLFRIFPDLPQFYPRWNLAFKVGFGIVFFFVRVIGWLPLASLFILDNLADLLNGTDKSSPITLLQMVGCGVLTYLQVSWFVRIVRQALNLDQDDRHRPYKYGNYY